MPEIVEVSLEPAAILLQSGGDTAEATATVQNKGEILDQYNLEIEGLDRTWYTIHAPLVGLFPGDRSDVRISFHPPKRNDIRAGDYPFLIKAVSQVDSARTGSAKGFMKIQPFAVFKAEVNPQRAEARRSARYQVGVSNSGSVDLVLDLKAADKEGECRFDWSPETITVAPGDKATASVSVHPKRGWFKGASKNYDFTVTVIPQGARGEPKALNGSLLHRPLISSWTPALRGLKTLVVLILLLTGFGFLLQFGGGVYGYQRGITQLIERAKEMGGGFMGSPNTGTPKPSTSQAPAYVEGFKVAHDAQPQLVGDPVENQSHDSAGNAYQNTTKGTLFWLKSTNVVYFFTTEEVYVFRDGRSQVIDRKSP